jgi:hypothetical protein
MKNGVFWDVAPCKYCINRRFGGTHRLNLQGRRKKEKSASEEPAWAGGCSFILLPWRWRRYVPPKRRFIQYLHGATSQKTAFFLSIVLFIIKTPSCFYLKHTVSETWFCLRLQLKPTVSSAQSTELVHISGQNRTMDNVQKHNICIDAVSSQNLDLI